MPMRPEWTKLCRDEAFTVDGEGVIVTLAHERRHRIEVRDAGDVYELHGIVARGSVVRAQPDLPLRIWERNRATELVGFRIDRRKRLLGESWVPKAGLTAAEFGTYLRHLAAVCDRLEFLLTGSDLE
jgi:hypothetical protein